MRRYDPQKHHRRSIRLPGYDYRQPGAYSVTVCTQDRECLLGRIVDGEMWLSEAGQMVQTVWDGLPERYPGVDVDEFVVMPNHIHGIIVLIANTVGATPRGCPGYTAVNDVNGQARGPAPTDKIDGVAGLSLPDVVHRFKSFTTAQYRHGVRNHGCPPFPGRLWQRNYYEHIIRDERELRAIRRYICDNPARWTLDRDNPDNLRHLAPPADLGDYLAAVEYCGRAAKRGNVVARWRQ